MGDAVIGNQPTGDFPDPLQGTGGSGSKYTTPPVPDHHGPSGSSSGLQHASQMDSHASHPYYNAQPPRPDAHQDHAPPGYNRSGAFNMGAMTNALSNLAYSQNFQQQPSHSQRFPSGASTAALVYQLQQVSQFAGQAALSQSSGQAGFNAPYQPQQQYYRASPHMPQSIQTGSHPGQFFPAQPFSPTGLPTHQHQQHAQQASQPYFYPTGQYSQQGPMYPGALYAAQPPRHGNSSAGNGGGGVGRQRSSEHLAPIQGSGRQSSTGSGSSHPSTPRGPPRKPKQSGHALWVGNLPPGTNVVDLKDHFSREATEDIESVFLISKSNCAFVNYKTEATCAAAMARFHDSRFQGVRLVCRLRRSTANANTGIPTGPAALSSPPTGSKAAAAEEETKNEAKDEGPAADATPAKDKFFIVKSLTIEDLELSVQNGIWATQSHNEDALNKAFKTAENVYLFFSANKSGEYFGYARMTSPINDDPAAAIEFAPKAQAVEDPDLPRAIPTAATEFAPKGRIIDDSARGTIFWEAEPLESEDAEDNSEGDEPEGESKAWGKPFKLEWISLNRLPFYRTRGLRNPWNSNREVKIARDGTELETSVGRRLITMFHRDPSPQAPQMQMMGGAMTLGQMAPFS